MKKALFAVLIVFVATTVWAGNNLDPTQGNQVTRDREYKVFGSPLVQFDISGEFDARGYYWDNRAMAADDTVTHSYYRGYLDIWPKLKIGDTQVITKFEIADQNPWAPQVNGSDNFDATYDSYTSSKRANISVERAYIHHNFTESFFTEIGMMDGQWWGTSFGDYQLPRWRVKFQGMTPVGALGALVEKNCEMGNASVEDSEKDDYDAYAIYGVTKAGDITIEPLIFYIVNSAFNRTAPYSVPGTTIAMTGLDNGNDGVTVLYVSLASRGKLGPLGMEAELNYKKWDFQGITYAVTSGTTTIASGAFDDNDWTEYGAYLNLWNDMDFGRLGCTLAYGSYDEDGGVTGTGAGLDFRQDFKSNLILGDEIAWGSSSAEDLVGMTLIKPYIKNVKLADKLTCSGSFGYIMSNQKDNAYEDATAMELDLGVQYKFTDNFAYKVDAGYADIDYDQGDDPDAIMVLRHEVVVTF